MSEISENLYFKQKEVLGAEVARSIGRAALEDAKPAQIKARSHVLLEKTDEDSLQAVDLEIEDLKDEEETETSTESTTEGQTGLKEGEEDVTLSEFKTQLGSNSKLDKLAQEFGYDKLFDLFDTNKDGKISSDEISALSNTSTSLEDITAGELKKIISNAQKSEKSADADDESKFNKLLESLKKELGLDKSAETNDAAQNTAVAPTYSSGSVGGGGSYSVPSSTGASTSASANTSSTSEEKNDIDEQIKQLEEVDIPKNEEELSSLAETKDEDIKKQQEIQEKAIEESDEIDEELKEKYAEAEETLKETQDKKSETEKTKSSKESELSSVQSNISEIDAQIGSIKVDSDDEEQNAENQKKIDELKSQKTELEKQEKQLKEEIKELKDEIDELDDSIEEQEQAKDDILEEIKENLDPNSPLLKTIEETEEEIDKINETYEKKSGELQATLEEQRAELTQLKEQRGKETGEAQNKGNLEKMMEKIKDFAGGVFDGMGEKIQEIANKYGLDPALLTSIMAHETGYGTSPAVKNENNPGGMMDPSTNYSQLMSYTSLEEGIEAVARNLSNNYLGKGLTNISSIGAKYCPVGAANDPTGLNGNWVPGVLKIYNELTGKNISASTNISLT